MLLVVWMGTSEEERSARLRKTAGAVLNTVTHRNVFMDGSMDWRACLQEAAEAPQDKRRIIFCIALPKSGICIEQLQLEDWLRTHFDALEGFVGGAVVDGAGELYTKSAGRELLAAANAAGCALPGKPLVEATGNLMNFQVRSRNAGSTREEAYIRSVEKLVKKVCISMPEAPGTPNILVLHAGNRRTSNTLMLWDMVQSNLPEDAAVQEISLRNGEIMDCRGCTYETCLHFGEHERCFYGGVIVEQVYPAILNCSTLVLVCPNYNDTVNANFLAFFNRLTALFRNHEDAFSKKRVFAVVVSGYSGGELVSEQILDSMCCNKNFILPGKFALLETANDPLSVGTVSGVQQRAAEFAKRICK